MRGIATRLAFVVVAAVLSACPPPPSLSPPTALPTGTTPNAAAVVHCEDGPRLLVAASADARLDVLDPTGVAPPRSVFLGAGTSPWDVAVVRHGDGGDDASRAVVTLVGSHGVGLVRPCGDPVHLHTMVDDTPFSLPEPIALRAADDVDGDGIDETTVTQMTPRTPQAAAVSGDDIFVAWANLLDISTGVDAPMLAAPALLLRLRLSAEAGNDDDDALVVVDRILAPTCENPGAVAVVAASGEATRIAMGCSGRFVLAPAGHSKASDGGLVLIDVEVGRDPAVVSTTAAATPGPVVVHDGAVVTGDLLDGALRRYTLDGLIEDGVVAGAGGIDSAFSLMVADDGVLMAGWFDGRLRQDPFGTAIDVPAPAGPPRGLVDLVDDGDRVWGLLSLAGEIVVLPRAAP